MNIGVIGTGAMGKNHVRVYSELRGVEDVYIFDLKNADANAMKKMGFIVCDSMDKLLDHVDAVSICVPTKNHFDVARAAIEKNIPCLIEKPVTMSIEEGQKLLDLLKNKEMIVGVGHIERFNPIVNEIKKMIENPFFIEMRRHNPASSRITDSSVVEDLMIHDIDIVFNVLLDVENYNIYSGGNREACKALIAFEDSVASLSASRKACKKIRNIYIEDDKFTIEGDFMAQDIYIYWKPEKYGLENEKYTQENIIEKVLVNKVEPLKVELRTFLDCVKNGTEFPITPEQALNNLRICVEIEKRFE